MTYYDLFLEEHNDMTYYDLFLEDFKNGTDGVQINSNHYPMFKGKTLKQEI